ncbi:SDR family NAD(P)-dependent oxidoreductase [Kribbella sp. CA-293567]|uniref:SDR family NAD(P)-dependent oxidoreductase n=1 Tax=Kribbella sp. CA-293567 TaxID=3002436 RepID=UPI0022DE1978|nr:SDR family oxidoreductase [Kribbella sp. CA-293567]WBQ04395.1 SDR family NAD(P)-dependent oxidoreductase [Kribbella sp. CA-293567]
MTTSSTELNHHSTPFAGRTALVTGSTSGIGAATAHLLAARGAHVIVSGRDAARGDDIVTAIRAAGGKADFVAADLAGDAGTVREFATRAIAVAGGRIDILVNNAGTYPATLTPDLPDAALDAMLAVNVRAPHVLVAQIAPGMADRGSGVIVTIGSWMALVGSPFAAMYTATKAADHQLTRAWAAEFGPRGVRVNTVAPGVTLTPGNEADLAIVEQMAATTPAGSPVSPDDIAYAVAFLASDEARMIHGATLHVDGGITATRLA